MNKPFLQAFNFYLSYGRDFELEMSDCLENGFIASASNYFVMAKAVELAPQYYNGKPRHAWLVAMAIGPLWLMVRAMPFPLPFIAFYRRRAPDRLRVISTARLLKRLEGSKQCHS